MGGGKQMKHTKITISFLVSTWLFTNSPFFIYFGLELMLDLVGLTHPLMIVGYSLVLISALIIFLPGFYVKYYK